MAAVSQLPWHWGLRGCSWARRFCPCPESAVAPVYRDALSRSAAGDAQITRAFSGRPARGLENRFTREMRGLEDSVPDFPILNALTGPLRKASGQAGNTDFMSLWAGQSAPLSATSRGRTARRTGQGD
ncbi:MAG: hypothetical protein CM1200mP41_05010 [Gammaproteobacteria bacterium]|nr:MAG: hypothetical protein CM1200mP41_05010 [Gammaproteobacteria bacterium]